MSNPVAPIPPGSTIGIVGGGQLGRMTVLAAANLGYKCHIFCPEDRAPASKVANLTVRADYRDEAALKRFASDVDVVTFEFENIPHESVQLLTELAPVRPSWRCLQISQDRLVEKDFMNGIGVATTPYRRVESLGDLEDAVALLGRPSVLKTARMGYDGKGQVKIDDETALSDAWSAMEGGPAILEAFVDFEREISVIVARSPNGEVAAYEPVHNVHTNHILDTTTAPAGISEHLAKTAITMATRTAEEMGLVGLLAVEMFVTRDNRLMVNEVAPRPHNSGHWTMDGAATSQFEQFVRAVCGLPLGATERLQDTVMTNLLGDDIETWPELLTEPNARLHLYGKLEARPGRKMGHVNRLFPKNGLES